MLFVPIFDALIKSQVLIYSFGVIIVINAMIGNTTPPVGKSFSCLWYRKTEF